MTQATSLVFLALVHVAAAGDGDSRRRGSADVVDCRIGKTVLAYIDGRDGEPGDRTYDIVFSYLYEAVITSVAPDGSIGVTCRDGTTANYTNGDKLFMLTKEGCNQRPKRQWKTNQCPTGDVVWADYDDSFYPSCALWYEVDIVSQLDAVSHNVQWHWSSTYQSSKGYQYTLHLQKCVGSAISSDPWDCFPCVDYCRGLPDCSDMSLSGDPVVHIGGHTVKFELPMRTQTLLWDDHGFEIFGQADLVTPDKKSQWFSEFLLVNSGRKVATIQRKAIDAAGKERPGALNTLSLAIYDEEARPKVITAPGSYSIGNGINSTGQVLVKRKDAKLGPMRKEEVFVKYNALSFSITAEMAKKFNSRFVALKYTHLDIQLLKTSSDVTRGIFAELFGFIPMSSKTANMIRSVTS